MEAFHREIFEIFRVGSTTYSWCSCLVVAWYFCLVPSPDTLAWYALQSWPRRSWFAFFRIFEVCIGCACLTGRKCCRRERERWKMCAPKWCFDRTLIVCQLKCGNSWRIVSQQQQRNQFDTDLVLLSAFLHVWTPFFTEESLLNFHCKIEHHLTWPFAKEDRHWLSPSDFGHLNAIQPSCKFQWRKMNKKILSLSLREGRGREREQNVFKLMKKSVPVF